MNVHRGPSTSCRLEAHSGDIIHQIAKFRVRQRGAQCVVQGAECGGSARHPRPTSTCLSEPPPVDALATRSRFDLPRRRYHQHVQEDRCRPRARRFQCLHGARELGALRAREHARNRRPGSRAAATGFVLPTGRRSLPPPLHRRAPRAPGETGANSAARRAHPSIPFRRSADVEAKLKEIVAEQLGVEQASITAEASFASDLGADSLDVVEMARIPASFCRFRRRAAAAEPPNLTVARAAGHEDRGGVRRRAPRRARRGGPEPQRRRPRRQRPPVNAQNTEAQALPPNPRRTVFKYQR